MRAHWSGNQYSQPFDWDENDLGWFLWSSENPQGIFEMVLGEFSAPVFYDASLRILWDRAAGNVPNWPPWDRPEDRNQYRTEATAGLQGQVVPDGGSTLLFLGATLGILAIVGPRFRSAK